MCLLTGTVLPQSRCAIVLSFRPQEEVVYNFNVLCDVKRKPNKLSLNIKGEGYAVHPLLQLETDEGSASAGMPFYTHPHTLIYTHTLTYTLRHSHTDAAIHAFIDLSSDTPLSPSTTSLYSPPAAGLGFVTLRPSPAINYVDFGAVQINDTVKRKITISNNGKYNFDFLWDNDAVGAGHYDNNTPSHTSYIFDIFF